MQPFADFLKLYNNKAVVPTSEAMQKMIDFYHNKVIDGDQQTQNFIPLPKQTDFLEKIREHMVEGQSIVFTRPAELNETFTRKSENLCESYWYWYKANLSPLSVSTNA